MENRKVTQRFYTTKDAATYLGLAPRTLQKYRVDGSGHGSFLARFYMRGHKPRCLFSKTEKIRLVGCV